jgi:hypothetical protein
MVTGLLLVSFQRSLQIEVAVKGQNTTKLVLLMIIYTEYASHLQEGTLDVQEDIGYQELSTLIQLESVSSKKLVAACAPSQITDVQVGNI